ncbi:hypothetical protein KC221_27195, partial [Mycobacterium tuberculosis]|nr:hypothetical protein [Mycobacterium tuberculosis]
MALRDLLDERPRPARDEKTITEWNALAITALAEAALYRHPDDRASVWGSTATAYWEAMLHRFGTGVGDPVSASDDVEIPA